MPLLTKSRFTIAYDCPTKLYYSNHPETYANASIGDSFLQALADGGFQVGALAKKYYPSSFEITTRDHVAALAETAELLKKDTLTIHEAAFGYADKFFIKADIVIKEGNQLQLIEVKAKSFRSTDPNEFNTLKDRKIRSGWKEYIYDIAFQYWVVVKAFPELKVTPYLLLADKDKTATIDGLHQMFKISRNGNSGFPKIISTALAKDALGEEVLGLCDVTVIVKEILEQEDFENTGMSFEAYIYELAQLSVNDIKQYKPIGKSCKGCEFVKDPVRPDLKSGMLECWKKKLPELSDEELERQKYFDVWNWRINEATRKQMENISWICWSWKILIRKTALMRQQN